KTKDFVFLHIEACDEAGHEGDLDLKIRCIQDIDRRVVKRVLDEMLTWDEPVTIALLPDHPTPIATRTHTMDPVPFVIYRTGIEADQVDCYDELAAREGGYGLIDGDQFMTLFAGK
ncbi:MAG: phosphoglycerate mutase, partial [Bacteroidales bacterium]